MNHATANTLDRFRCNHSVCPFLNAFSPLRDVDIFARRKRPSWGALDQARSRFFVGELCCRFATRLSLYKPALAGVLQGGCGLVGSFDVPFLRSGSVLDYISESLRLAGLDLNFHRMVEWLFGVAIVAGLYGVFNASWTRITRTTVRLANLPASWRGRRAALISDLHLGHVRNGSFLRRMVAKILREEPDAIFIAGDLYDGTAIDAGRAAEPLNELTAPQGVYFVAGNHEQFGDDSKYLRAIAAAGVRVLSNEKVEADGLQIIGVPYRNATQEGALSRRR